MHYVAREPNSADRQLPNPAGSRSTEEQPVRTLKKSRGKAERPSGDESWQMLLPIYLREMGSTNLLSDEEQFLHARRFHEARRSLSRMALRLPKRSRGYFLDDDVKGPRSGANWAVDKIHRFCRRILDEDVPKELTPKPQFRARVKRLRDDLHSAREALIVGNLRLVVHIAKQHLRRGIAFIDLIQEGNLGLMRAVEKFEYDRGNKFSTYAYWWIKQSVDRSIADKARIIRLPVHMTEFQKKVRRTVRELAVNENRKPDVTEIAEELGVPGEKVREAIGAKDDAISLDATTDQDPSPLRIADEKAPAPDEAYARSEIRSRVQDALRDLDEREREIVRLRYGIGSDGTHTLEQIGRHMGLSRERVRQIEVGALKRLKQSDVLAELLDNLGAS